MSKIVNKTKVITGPRTRWSYANVWDPKSINGGAPKYSVSLIIPKSDTQTIAKIKAAIQAAYEEGESKLKGSGKSVPALSVLKTPLRDGDTERPDDEAYKDSYFVNARLPASWTRTGTRFWNARKYIPACTAGRPSISTPSTQTETKGLPAA